MARILWHSCAPWAPSGYGTQTGLWARKLRDMGHDIAIDTYWGLSGGTMTWDGINVLPGFGANYCSPSLHQHAMAAQPDLVITLGDIWVMDAKLLSQLPVAHWLPSDCRPMSLVDRANVEASGAEVIAMSRFGYERFTEAGLDPVYVPHGIDTSLFNHSPEVRASVRERLELGDNFAIGINAANNDAIRKAIPEMMLAFAKFHRKHPDSRLLLHTGVHQDGGQDLECLAEILGITDLCLTVDQYRYHAGFIAPGDLVEWYNALDVLAGCTYGEGFGIPIVEAQSCGVPVITTDASSMTELNPYGPQVTGEPFWNGVHRGWWIKPSVPQIVAAFEEAYERRHAVDREKYREFALTYDVDVVAERFMRPAVDELVDRMRKRGKIPPVREPEELEQAAPLELEAPAGVLEPVAEGVAETV